MAALRGVPPDQHGEDRSVGRRGLQLWSTGAYENWQAQTPLQVEDDQPRAGPDTIGHAGTRRGRYSCRPPASNRRTTMSDATTRRGTGGPMLAGILMIL